MHKKTVELDVVFMEMLNLLRIKGIPEIQS